MLQVASKQLRWSPDTLARLCVFRSNVITDSGGS
jgi:hypothetical protein